MRLLVFEGIERSSPDSYLVPLLRNRISSSVTQTEKGEADDFTWPENVLIAATAATHSLATGVSTELSEFCTFLCLDLLGADATLSAMGNMHPEKRTQAFSELPSKYVDLESWREWRRQSEAVELGSCSTEWARVTDGLPVGRAKRDLALRYFSAGMTVADELSADLLTKALVVLPNLVHDERRLKALLSEIAPIYPQAEQALRIWTGN